MVNFDAIRSSRGCLPQFHEVGPIELGCMAKRWALDICPLDQSCDSLMIIDFALFSYGSRTLNLCSSALAALQLELHGLRRRHPCGMLIICTMPMHPHQVPHTQLCAPPHALHGGTGYCMTIRVALVTSMHVDRLHDVHANCPCNCPSRSLCVAQTQTSCRALPMPLLEPVCTVLSSNTAATRHRDRSDDHDHHDPPPLTLHSLMSPPSPSPPCINRSSFATESKEHN
jgi:hypothetical protein